MRWLIIALALLLAACGSDPQPELQETVVEVPAPAVEPEALPAPTIPAEMRGTFWAKNRMDAVGNVLSWDRGVVVFGETMVTTPSGSSLFVNDVQHGKDDLVMVVCGNTIYGFMPYNKPRPGMTHMLIEIIGEYRITYLGEIQ